RSPLRTGASMVEGQPVCVQSPARNRPGVLVSCAGRQRSTPGSGEKVAAASLITVALTSFASRAAGRAWRTSFKHKSMISSRDFLSKSYEALMTSWRYWPDVLPLVLPLWDESRSVTSLGMTTADSRATEASFWMRMEGPFGGLP